jgi:peptide/nickel transport system substrate-binding protein
MQVRAILLAAALVLAPLAARAEAVVRWAPPEPAVTWDPHGAEVGYTIYGQLQVYDRLLYIDPDLRVQPGLATSWRLVDPTTWRFELRPGVRFHDGSPLTAEDVVFSLNRARGPTSDIRQGLAGLAEVWADGPTAVVIRTQGTDVLLPMRMRVGIMSARWAREHGVAEATTYHQDKGTFARDHAMGAGPFRLEQAVAGGSAVLVRNPDWWGLAEHSHPIDRIVWTPIPDGHERVAALLRGEVDFTQDLPPDEAGRLRSAPGVRIRQVAELRVNYIGFNQSVSELPGSDVKGANPFRDRRVREAVYRAVDIDELIVRGEAGLAVPAGMLAVPGVNGYDPELDRRLPHDPEEARRLLAEAGYPGGFAVPLLCQSSQEPACRTVVEQLARAGIRARPDIHPPVEYFPLLDGAMAGFWLNSVGSGVLDSAFIFGTLYHTDGWVESKGYGNAELDALIDTANSEISSAVRDMRIEQIWRQVLPDVLVVPLYRRESLFGTRDWLDVPVSALNVPYFREARLR